MKLSLTTILIELEEILQRQNYKCTYVHTDYIYGEICSKYINIGSTLTVYGLIEHQCEYLGNCSALFLGKTTMSGELKMPMGATN